MRREAKVSRRLSFPFLAPFTPHPIPRFGSLTFNPINHNPLSDVNNLDPRDVRIDDRFVELLLISDSRPVVLHGLVGVPAFILRDYERSARDWDESRATGAKRNEGKGVKREESDIRPATKASRFECWLRRYRPDHTYSLHHQS